MTFLEEIWDRSGQPEPNWQGKARTPRTAPEPRQGVCALTGRPGPVWPLNKISPTLGSYLDRMPYRDIDPAGIALGPAAAWALRHRLAMQLPHVDTGDGLHEIDAAGLHAALTALPQRHDVVVSVPISRQKHVLAWAQPGCVGTDDRWLPWTHRDVDTLDSYVALRQLGFGETALGEPSPRWPILAHLDRDAKQWTLMHWDDLAVWRHDPTYLEVAARATRTPKETP